MGLLTQAIEITALCCCQFIAIYISTGDAACGDTGGLPRSLSVNETTPASSFLLNMDSNYVGSFTVTSGSQYTCYFAVSSGSLTLFKMIDLENMTSCVDGTRITPSSIPNTMQITLSCVSGGQDLLFITLIDIDEFPPTFNPANFFVNVSEAATTNTLVIQLSSYVSDADKTRQTTFSFLLLSGALGKFSMPDTTTSGNIRVSGELDYDFGQRTYLLNVSAAELTGIPAPLTGYTTVTVSVLDFDDQNPAFLSATYSISFMENDSSILGQLLQTTPPLQAWDLDYGINQTINYAIDSGAIIGGVTFMDISNTTGQLRVIALVDRETMTQNPIVLRVRAYQTDKPSLRTAVALVTVTVTDKNDNPPVMSAQLYSASLVENSLAGAFVVQMVATDADYGSNATVAYNLSDPSGAFLINSATGIVRVGNSTLLDRETTPAFNLTVWAQESQTVERWTSGQSRLFIQLLDLNDNAPTFAQPSGYAFNVSAAAMAGTTVGVISATDPDLGVNGAMVYSLVFASSGSLAYFQINSLNGSLTLTATLPATYASTSYLLMAQAEDQADPPSLRLRSTVIITVMVTPLDTTTAPTTTTPSTTTTTTTTTTTPSTPTTTTTPSTTTTATSTPSPTTSTASTLTSSTSTPSLTTKTTINSAGTSSTLASVSASTGASSVSIAPSAASQTASTSSTTTAVTSSSVTSNGNSAAVGSGAQAVLIAVIAVTAVLLVASLAAIYYFWKVRGGAGVAVAPAVTAAGMAASGGTAGANTTVRPSGGAKGKLINHDSSRINYSEFYYDDKDVAGNPIMVNYSDYQRPPSYSQIPGRPEATDSTGRIAEVST